MPRRNPNIVEKITKIESKQTPHPKCTIQKMPEQHKQSKVNAATLSLWFRRQKWPSGVVGVESDSDGLNLT